MLHVCESGGTAFLVLDPEAGGDTYQIDRAITAIIEGGWFGMGPGVNGGAKSGQWAAQ